LVSFSRHPARGTVTPKKADKLAPLWIRFEKSGSIQDYLKYFQAKQAKVTKPAVAKIGVKRKKATA
jgi:hypothetical protein